jgi:hypothetical protein
LSKKCEKLDVSQPYGSSWPVIGIAFFIAYCVSINVSETGGCQKNYLQHMCRMIMEVEHTTLLERRDPGRPKNGWRTGMNVEDFTNN